MSLFNNAITGASGNQGYNIARSVRLRQSASAYFNRTAGVAPTSNQKGTFSFWFKRGSLATGSEQWFFAGGSNSLGCGIPTNNVIFIEYFGGLYLYTTQVFRDPSAWYHMVFAIDTTQATAANRAKLYINGVQVTSFTTEQYPSQNATFNWMASGQACYINQIYSGGRYFDGYMAEFNYIDGQQLTPSSFGETNSITGVWQPKAYSGTYGTNGFELNFSDNSNNTAATIGKDYSGNGNNWTPNNISVTAGVTYDSMVDSPTVGSLSSNYAVWNVLKSPSTYGTITNGNLTTNANTTYELNAISSISSTTGKFYAEFTVQQANTARPNIGIQAINQYQTYTGANLVSSATTVVWSQDGRVFANASLVGTFATYTTGDIICVAVDCDNGAIYYNKNNGAWINSGSPTSGASRTGSLYNWTGGTVDYGFYIDDSFNGNITNANFGQRPFSYTPPTGFVALNTYNLPASTIKNGAAYMAATTYTGNVTARNISNAVNGVSFQPDLVWLKNRTTAYGHVLQDSIRGTSVYLASNSTAADTAASLVTAFNSDGFAVSTSNVVNENSAGIVGWQWKAGGTSSSNTNGSITSTVSVGATQGFSVVTYTGTGSSATVGHGLGVAPSMIICKARGQAENWAVYHSSLSNAVNVAMFLNLTNAVSGASNAYWNSTAPSSTVFSVNTATTTNAANTMVAYCFAAVAGYSAFGSYTGNGSSDGPFLYTGFRPRFFMYKRTDSAGSWVILDSSRNPSNVTTQYLYPNAADAEVAAVFVDFVSNGVKFRTTYTDTNGSGFSYIYACFAEVPFKTSLAR